MANSPRPISCVGKILYQENRRFSSDSNSRGQNHYPALSVCLQSRPGGLSYLQTSTFIRAFKQRYVVQAVSQRRKPRFGKGQFTELGVADLGFKVQLFWSDFCHRAIRYL